MRHTGVVVWQQVASRLRRDIEDKLFAESERLPNEQELAARYGVNRHTLRQAVGSLAEQGVLDVRQGKGTFLRKPGFDYPLSSHTRFTENISRHNRSATGRLVRADRVAAPADMAADLGIEAGADLVLLEVLHMANGQQITLSEHYFPTPRFDGMQAAFEETGSITASLRTLGVDNYMRRTTRLVARLPTTREAGLLKQARSQPIVVVRAVNVDGNERPIEFGISRFCAERVQFVFQT